MTRNEQLLRDALENLIRVADAAAETENTSLMDDEIEAARAILAATSQQAEGEPVAWKLEFVDEYDLNRCEIRWDKKSMQEYLDHNTNYRKIVTVVTPLYAAPLPAQQEAAGESFMAELDALLKKEEAFMGLVSARAIREIMERQAASLPSPAPQAAVPSERTREFSNLCELLPADSHWMDELTPDLLRRILARAALASPVVSDSEILRLAQLHASGHLNYMHLWFEDRALLAFARAISLTEPVASGDE